MAERRGGHNRLERRDEVLELLPKLVAKQPSAFGWHRSRWSVELVAIEVRRQLDIKVSRTQIGRMLAEAGCRKIVPKPTIALAPPDHAAQFAALKAKLATEAGPDDVVLFADEIDIHLNPKSGADWTPPGVRKELTTPGKNAKHYVAGAYEPKDKRLITFDGASKSSALFIGLVQLLAEVFAKSGTIHIILDNFIIHKSKVTTKAIAELKGKVVLHFLPPYCPQYNPIERVWWDVHEHVTRNHSKPTIEALMDDVRRYVDHYDSLGVAIAGSL